MCSFLCIFFQKKIVFLLSKKKYFFLKKILKFFFLLSFTSNLLSFTTFYSVLPRLVLSFTKYPRHSPMSFLLYPRMHVRHDFLMLLVWCQGGIGQDSVTVLQYKHNLG